MIKKLKLRVCVFKNENRVKENNIGKARMKQAEAEKKFFLGNED